MHKSRSTQLFCLLLGIIAPTIICAKELPLEFLSKPQHEQLIKTGQTSLVFYTLKNHTDESLPLIIKTTSKFLTVSPIGNTCGIFLGGGQTCVLPLKFSAPSTSQTLNVGVHIGYQGRTELRDSLTYQVDASIACRLLNEASFETPFCQQQYQNLVKFTPDVFNTTHLDNVKEEQSLGGVIAVYQHHKNADEICYISCGLKELHGTPPDQHTIFELASVTKTFTTSILGKKVFEQTIDPFVSINSFLPTGSWLGRSYHLNVQEQPVTFQQLATFSGGVCFSDAPDVDIHDTTEKKQADFVKDINLLDLTNKTCLGSGENAKPVYGPPAFLPSLNHYSNSSVGLLGQVIMGLDNYEQMDEGDFNGWMCQHILTPLNMNMTNACLPNEAKNKTCPHAKNFCNTSQWSEGEYASGYHINAHAYQLGDPFPYVPWAPAGILRSNAVDMIKFVKANLGIQKHHPELSSLIEGMQIAHQSNNYLPVPSGAPTANIGSQTPLVGGQGFAWVCDPSSSNKDAICGKIGGHPNFRSFVGFQKSSHYGIVLLFNTGAVSTTGDGTGTSSTIPTVADIGVNMISKHSLHR